MSDHDPVPISFIEHTNTNDGAEQTFQEVNRRLGRYDLAQDQFMGRLPRLETTYRSNFPPYCVSDSFLYAMLASGVKVEDIIKNFSRLGVRAGQQNPEEVIVTYLHERVAGKPHNAFVDFPTDALKMLQLFARLGILAHESTIIGNIPDLYDAVLDGWKGVIGLPNQAHAIAVVGAMQHGPSYKGGSLMVVDPMRPIAVEHSFSEGYPTVSFSKGKGSTPLAVPYSLEDFTRLHHGLEGPVNIPGLVNSVLFRPVKSSS